jgi:hypothetical protein
MEGTMQSEPFSEGLTEETDIEVKESLLAMQVRFLKHGMKWYIQRFRAGNVEHILLSTHPVKGVNLYYHNPESEEEETVTR